jgi:hypothetical protein
MLRVVAVMMAAMQEKAGHDLYIVDTKTPKQELSPSGEKEC